MYYALKKKWLTKLVLANENMILTRFEGTHRANWKARKLCLCICRYQSDYNSQRYTDITPYATPINYARVSRGPSLSRGSSLQDIGPKPRRIPRQASLETESPSVFGARKVETRQRSSGEGQYYTEMQRRMGAMLGRQESGRGEQKRPINCNKVNILNLDPEYCSTFESCWEWPDRFFTTVVTILQFQPNISNIYFPHSDLHWNNYRERGDSVWSGLSQECWSHPCSQHCGTTCPGLQILWWFTATAAALEVQMYVCMSHFLQLYQDLMDVMDDMEDHMSFMVYMTYMVKNK